MQVPRHLAGAQQGGLASRAGGPFPHDSMGQNRRTCIGRLLRSQPGSCIGCAIASERAEIASGTARLTKTNAGRSVPCTAHSFDDGSREFVGLRRVVRIDREDGEERLRASLEKDFDDFLRTFSTRCSLENIARDLVEHT